MRGNTMKIVEWVRAAVYLSGFIAAIWILVCCTEKDPIPMGDKYDLVFFPPDLAPHPHFPWDQPSGPKDPDMA